MTGNHDISRVTGIGRVLEMSWTALQRQRIGAMQDHRRECTRGMDSAAIMEPTSGGGCRDGRRRASPPATPA